MRRFLYKIVRYSGLSCLFRELLQRRKVSIVMMHDMPAEAARHAFVFWKKNYNVISMRDFMNWRADRKNTLPAKSLILTFDDGHRGNYELLPLIEELKIPVTVFLSAGIVGTNRHFWFMQDDIDRDKMKNISNEERLSILASKDFYETKEFSERQALSDEEIKEMAGSPYIDLQSHGIFHSILTQCSDKKAREEVVGSKKMLEQKYELFINGFAYTNGYYTGREIEMVKKAGYAYAVTADAGYNSSKTDLFKLKRFSINDLKNMDEIVVKTSGVWGIVKRTLRFQKKK